MCLCCWPRQMIEGPSKARSSWPPTKTPPPCSHAELCPREQPCHLLGGPCPRCHTCQIILARGNASSKLQLQRQEGGVKCLGTGMAPQPSGVQFVFGRPLGLPWKCGLKGFFYLLLLPNTPPQTNNTPPKKPKPKMKSKNKHFCRTPTLIWMQATLWPPPGSWFYLLILSAHFSMS